MHLSDVDTVDVIVSAITMTMVSSTILIILKMHYKYNGIANNDQANRNQFKLSFVYSVVTILGLVVSIIIQIANNSLFHEFWSIFLGLYAMHAYVLLLLLFCRLYYVFMDPIFRLKPRVRTIIIFKTLLILIPILMIFTHSLYYIQRQCTLVIFVMTIYKMMVMSSMISLISLFFLKLNTFVSMKSTKNSDSKSASVFVKHFVLSLMSLFITAVTNILIIVHCMNMDDSSHKIHAITNWVAAINIYFNFLFTFLTFTPFNEFYQMLCASIHSNGKSLILSFGHKQQRAPAAVILPIDHILRRSLPLTKSMDIDSIISNPNALNAVQSLNLDCDQLSPLSSITSMPDTTDSLIPSLERTDTETIEEVRNIQTVTHEGNDATQIVSSFRKRRTSQSGSRSMDLKIVSH